MRQDLKNCRGVNYWKNRNACYKPRVVQSTRKLRQITTLHDTACIWTHASRHQMWSKVSLSHYM